MANTTTANYGWQMPDPGGSANTWGNTLNATTQAIDAQVYSNQQAGVPVGSGALWFAATPPTNWLICDGSSVSTTTYAALFAVIGYTYGGSGANFNLPSMPGNFPFAAGGSSGVALGSIGGASSQTLSVAQLPAHAHSITDVTHNHGVNQSPHSHPDGTHSHGASGSQDPHSHTVGGTATSPGNGFAAGAGAQVGTENTSTAQPNVYVNINASGANIGAANANISLNPSGTGLSTTNAVGSGNPVPTMPPFLGVNFIVKYQ